MKRSTDGGDRRGAPRTEHEYRMREGYLLIGEVEDWSSRAAVRNCDVSMGMTQQDLAEELGTVREVISRELRRLSRAQLIASLRGGRYRLLDLPGLRRATDIRSRTARQKRASPRASRAPS